MFLSNRDIQYAIETGRLKVNPKPSVFDLNSIDLHLDEIRFAKIWNVDSLRQAQQRAGRSSVGPVLELGNFDYNDFSDLFLMDIPQPTNDSDCATHRVYRTATEVFVKPNGFLLWPTSEDVGTPKENPQLIAFVNAKSKKARTGIMVHFTAPTINAGWEDKITLEIINLGPFTFSLRPNDAIAQLTIAALSSQPDPNLQVPKESTPIAGKV